MVDHEVHRSAQPWVSRYSMRLGYSGACTQAADAFLHHRVARVAPWASGSSSSALCQRRWLWVDWNTQHGRYGRTATHDSPSTASATTPTDGRTASSSVPSQTACWLCTAVTSRRASTRDHLEARHGPAERTGCRCTREASAQLWLPRAQGCAAGTRARRQGGCDPQGQPPSRTVLAPCSEERRPRISAALQGQAARPRLHKCRDPHGVGESVSGHLTSQQAGLQ